MDPDDGSAGDGRKGRRRDRRRWSGDSRLIGLWALLRQKLAALSLIELMIVVALAAVIFAGLITAFLAVNRSTSRDGMRIAEANIAQDRIEQIRQLPYGTILPENLNNPPASPVFGDGRFGPTYTLAGTAKPFLVDYSVVDGAKTKTVTVNVRRQDSTRWTTMTTVIQDPAAAVFTGGSGSPRPTPSPSSTTGYYYIRVSFKNWKYVTSNGVKVVRTDVTPAWTAPPTKQVPNAGQQILTWSNLPGGPDITYVVTCYTTNGTFSTPPFHLLSDTPIHFDTNPGGD